MQETPRATHLVQGNADDARTSKRNVGKRETTMKGEKNESEECRKAQGKGKK